MKKLLLYLQNHQTSIAGLMLFALSVGYIIYISPRETKFRYEFTKGKPWLYDDLVAPYDFPVLKSPAELEEERSNLKQNRTLFLSKSQEVAENALLQFEKAFDTEWRKKEQLKRAQDTAMAQGDTVESPVALELSDQQYQRLLNKGRNILGRIYRNGILQPLEEELKNDGDVMLKRNGVNTLVSLQDFFSISEAARKIRTEFEDSPEAVQDFIVPLLQEQLQHNIVYNDQLTQNYLQNQLNEILPTRGVVQKGELIIFKGNIVDAEKYAKLNSLRTTYEGSYGKRGSFLYILLAQVLQVGILFTVLYIFLVQFRREVMEDISKITFILVNILFVITLVRLMLNFEVYYVYLIPFTVLPITIRSFFDTRLALFINMIAVLLAGFMVPNSFEFIFLQFVAGVFSIVMVSDLYKRSQLFFTAAKIIAVYCLAYLSLAIMQEGGFENINWTVIAFFGGNGFLTLMSFPLVYFQEKLFGFVSDVSLLELSDTNNQLLRELGQKAPGTFQHSIQVANLAEAAVTAIRGNALLVRTGALYHDIGKMSNPMYFIENQSTGLNPHDELSFEESAQIIINHVRQGIKMAKRHNLPDTIIDFIRTHHGTTTVMYFYRQYIKNFPTEEVDLAKFTYPGPKPFSKETAALMMADSVEAASRSLDKPDHDNIDKLVEGIIDHQMDTGQFENADITLKEIKDIKKIFKKMLMNIYHVRVQYPE